jgi:hypothetical protein
MSDFIEAIALLLPSDAGGRARGVAPRDGSYRPFARAADTRLRIRLIEGPPRLEPGQSGRVVAEIESGATDSLAAGSELDLMELEETPVGILTILRIIRSMATA